MKRNLLHLFLLLAASLAWAQKPNAPRQEVKLPFQDSLRVLLENTRNIDAATVGTAFSTVWASLGADHQQTIQRQARLMKKKGYKLRPHFHQYIGALVDAVNVEAADPSKISNFLNICSEVIESETPPRAAQFFTSARDFFQHHALHFEKSFRLYARDDSYRFEYVKTVSDIPVPDTTSQQGMETREDFSQTDVPADTLVPSAVPAWMQSSPQPTLTGPVVRFDRVTLNFATPYDSAFLENTKGSLSLLTNTFVGSGGRFNWQTAGLSPDSVFYELKEYNFNAKKPELKADQGRLTYVGRVRGKIDGVFEFRSVQRQPNQPAAYPRFKSFESNIEVLGLGDEGLKYKGGFALTGKKITGSSVNNTPSTIEVWHKGEKKFESAAREFEFQDSLILSKNASIKINQGNDSIYHPAALLNYDFGKKKLVLQRSKSLIKDAPYSSSFFNIDFDAQLIRWDMKSDSLNIFAAGGRSQAPMIIESSDYYDPQDYRLLGGVGFNFHALGLVASYALKSGVRDFYADDLAIASRQKPETIRNAMTFLADKGMIFYEPAWGKVRVKEKALHVYSSHKNETDYDDIKIHSIVDGPANASLNFKDRYMIIRGVDEFSLSDSLNVLIRPDSGHIKLTQDRGIKFNGKVIAGNFELNGKEFTLKYDSFFISLNQIDSIRFYVTETNSQGQTVRRRIDNAMMGLDSAAAARSGVSPSQSTLKSATLFVNRPNNKSGRLRIPNYPRLDATSGGVIYFDRDEVLGGAYDRSVFFVVPPFQLDSLSDADPGSINFEGTFVSSGMMPVFSEKLHTMPDKSLGFNHIIPQDGYQLYQDDGKLFGKLRLDNEGVRAAGRIEYLSAQLTSNDFAFFPDSVAGKGTGELVEKQIGSIWFPQVKLPEYKLKWMPKQDKFILKTTKDPFELYNGTAHLSGQLSISKKGTLGEGMLDTRGSELISNEMSFFAKEFNARHAKFQVKTTNPEKPALAGDDIKLSFNLAQNYVDISPEVQGVAAIEFPYAQFKTSITDARWNLTTQKITMAKSQDTPLEDSYFYTTREELDSLVFNAEKAEYDINAQQLKVSGVPYIVVADAKITPENSELLILENAKIGQLKNTVIVLDTLNAYHRLTEGVVDIVSRKQFSGYATYQYVNAFNDTFAIKMTDFHLEPMVKETEGKRRNDEITATQQTVANGAVAENDRIIIAPRIFYKGDMVMYATRPALQLNGYIKLDLRKIKNYNTWLRYNQSGDEKEIYLDFENTINEEGRRVNAGLHFSTDNNLYISFVTDKKQDEDEDFFIPSGSLFFDKETEEFKIEDRQKAAGEKLSGKVFAYNEDKQEVRFEGPVTFLKGVKDFNLVATALGSGKLETNEIQMNAFIIADINLPGTGFDIMARSIQEVIKNEGAAEGLGDQTELLYKIADIVGERAVKDYEQRSLQSYTPLTTLPQLVRPLVFSQVNIKWSGKEKAFYSQGDLGISNIGRNDINGAFDGFMEIKKNAEGDPVFHVFFKASPEAWFYFGFQDNRLMVHSSVASFNDNIAKKSNASKAKIGELVFIPGSDDETLAFINRFRQTYYGIETSYDLSGTTSAKKKDKKKEEAEDDGF